MTDISNFILNTDTDSFKINNEYTGTVTLSGTVVAGVNIKTFNVSLTESPDLIDIYITGPLIGYAANSWSKRGGLLVPDNAGYGGSVFLFGSVNMNGATVTLKFNNVQQFVGTTTLTATDVNYTIIDYSVL